MPRNEEDEPKAARLLAIFLRSYADLKQTELGEVTGLGQGAISRYETGKDDKVLLIMNVIPRSGFIPDRNMWWPHTMNPSPAMPLIEYTIGL